MERRCAEFAAMCYRQGNGVTFVPTIETPPTKSAIAGASVSLRVLAGAVILLFFYYAAGVVITLLLSILLAYFLDPAVELLEIARVPRTLGSMVMVLLLVAVLGAVGYGLFSRTSDFAANWPKYGGVLREAVGTVTRKINRFEGQVSQFAPEQSTTEQNSAPAPGKNTAATPVSAAAVARPDSGMLHTFILRGIGSLYALILEATFVPFLVFFMLAEKRQVWHGTLQLFPVSRRTVVKETLEDLRSVLRSYLAGMCIVTSIVIAISSAFFWFMGLDYPILTGIVSGLLNMVPYIGAVLAWLPAFLIALVKWRTLGSFVLIAGVLMSIHMLALNFIAPQLVGRRVRLNAVAITISLLFWGWVWGGMGLILAIPITATLRVICDHTESWKPVGRWLSA
ncbi:MAG TPA: AI-2E family transporter [Candidatus Dormibacteraeota bacterium]|nr:AI-2E family transporter [Candidatus Dormibacteraeota bacterium]